VGIASAKASVNSANLRTWSPPGSRLRVEYSHALLNRVRAQALENDATGVLFGVRRNGAVLLVEAGPASGGPPPRGLELVGIFTARPRGEVFLTEADLQRFGKIAAAVALVVAGTRAGFFVHEPDGSLQSIKSHREIPVAKLSTSAIHWLWPAIAMLAIPLLTIPSWRPRPPPGLAVTENAGQLRITWNPAAFVANGGYLVDLEIRDGATSIVIPVSSMLSSATYQPRSADVRIRLGSESVHFIGALSTMDLGH
jgi:hypothetical protein